MGSITDWTPPNYVGPGDASSAQFNVETVDNLIHVWERLGRVLLLQGLKAIPSGSGDTLHDTLTVVHAHPEIDYTLASGAVTLNDGGIFILCIRGSFASSTSGTTRLCGMRGDSIGNVLAPSAPPTNSIGHGMQLSGAIPAVVPAGEQFTFRGRQDSGADRNLDLVVGFVQLGPLP